MNVRILKGYVMTIVSGFFLLAGILLTILQFRNYAEFSLYGKNISIRLKQDGSITGGVNTALLMILSAVGGLVGLILTRVMISGLRSLRKGRTEEQIEAVKRLAHPSDETR